MPLTEPDLWFSHIRLFSRTHFAAARVHKLWKMRGVGSDDPHPFHLLQVLTACLINPVLSRTSRLYVPSASDPLARSVIPPGTP